MPSFSSSRLCASLISDAVSLALSHGLPCGSGITHGLTIVVEVISVRADGDDEERAAREPRDELRSARERERERV